MARRYGPGMESWWSDAEFWDELSDFIFPPDFIALGGETAAQAIALLGLAPRSDLLDLGCGFGRVAIPLARAGHRVTGVDAQARYLERARSWASREGVALELHHGDIAERRFHEAFDAVLSVFNSFGYFADPASDRRVVEHAWGALRPGGKFLLEVAHRDGVVRTMHVRDLEAADGRRFHEAPRFDPITGILSTEWTATTRRGTRTFLARSRPYTATELRDMLRQTGFVDIRFHGGLEGGPPSLDRYMIVAVATRPH